MVIITLQKNMSSPVVLIPHPQDKQEEETAAGTGNQARTSKKVTVTRHKMQRRCSLSIRRISLHRHPAAGGVHLPSHSQTTSASTLPSGESQFNNITMYYKVENGSSVSVHSQDRVQHRPKRDLPWLAHLKSQVCWQAESSLVWRTKHDF